MSTYSIVRNAIINKQIVIAEYDGHKREMCPHVIGTKNGKEQCLCYQFGGSSKSGNPVGWKCIVIDKLQNVTIHTGEWHTDTNHSKPQTCVDYIDVEVKF